MAGAPTARVGAVVIPVKSFTKAKERLAAVLDPAAREALARLTAERVIRAALDLPDVERVLVVADDENVAQWARSLGAESIVESTGLNPSVSAAYSEIGVSVDWVMVCHGDVVHTERLAALPSPGDAQAIIVRDRHRSGTNVLLIPAGIQFDFQYGPASAELHRAECEKRGLRPMEVLDDLLAVDIDTPDDLRLIPDWLRAELGPGE
jgi:2-phospho-L-lactate guanylyltransferase